ncbi:hypothetical protein BJ684DRAFT_20532 [Piptocephalis cylindrospora]|uniref:Uncharacterized protein n=1 Tax=Piptocephalis cylindrospora TaxID=1907219 RepID=A0A4P9Y293_9FUNG|nr:hypothetical protein BJ684DRAFT_20532 [Piptocephalis cylindrospora]|eukprot:RKP12947.1 hypothetical protein BJ684DRAFT_20532 [Piptocephalis cylindrospora]
MFHSALPSQIITSVDLSLPIDSSAPVSSSVHFPHWAFHQQFSHLLSDFPGVSIDESAASSLTEETSKTTVKEEETPKIIEANNDKAPSPLPQAGKRRTRSRSAPIATRPPLPSASLLASCPPPCPDWPLASARRVDQDRAGTGSGPTALPNALVNLLETREVERLKGAIDLSRS